MPSAPAPQSCWKAPGAVEKWQQDLRLEQQKAMVLGSTGQPDLHLDPSPHVPAATLRCITRCHSPFFPTTFMGSWEWKAFLPAEWLSQDNAVIQTPELNRENQLSCSYLQNYYLFFFQVSHTHKKNKKRKKKWNHRQSKSANSNVIAAIIRLLYRKSTWPLGCNHCSFLLTYLTFVLNTPLQILPGPWSLSPRWKVVPLL